MIERRSFIAASVSAAIAASTRSVFASSTIRTRLEIEDFSNNDALVSALRTAVKKLRNSPMYPANPETWSYWHYSRWMPPNVPMISGMEQVFNQCLHSKEYFYPWHRGLVYFFERALQAASGNDELMLPYWDYYKNPAIPQIYSDPLLRDGTDNPLYFVDRAGTGAGGIGFSAYDPSATVFPRSIAGGESYEALIENDPHATVHGSAGGAMGSVPTAGGDPIFWMHHCNVDRLWPAWVAPRNGRAMPPGTAPWWAKAWKYNVSGSWALSIQQMIDTRSLGYSYADLSLPTPTPTIPTPPPFVTPGPKVGALSTGANLVGTPGSVSLGLSSRSVIVPYQNTRGTPLHSMLEGRVPGVAGVAVELSNVTLSPIGAKGGYSYDIYLNLPEHVPERATFANITWALNSFSIGVASHGGFGTITFPASYALRRQLSRTPFNSKRAAVAFVLRGSFKEPPPPKTQLILVGAIRIVGTP